MLKNPDIGEAYASNINQYLEKGYIRRSDPTEKSPLKKWYLPHFPVVRPDRTTTKTRIVFDASAKFEGVSLRQRELTDVLLRFRRNPVALMCDTAEMYLRIEVASKDRPYQRFLWRTLNQERVPASTSSIELFLELTLHRFKPNLLLRRMQKNSKTSSQWPQRQC